MSAAATVTLAGVIRNSASGPSRTYHALFSDATSLNKGDDVRMAGVKVGTVTGISLKDNQVADVSFTVAKDAPMTRGTTAELRFRNLVGQRYVDLHPADSPAPALPAGYTFSLAQTKPALDLTLLFNGFQPLFQFLDPKDVNTLSGEIIAVFQGEGPTVNDLLSSTASLTSTLADRDHRAIVGLSMGGGQSLSIGLNRLEVFSYVGGFSASVGTSADFPKTYAKLVADSAATNQKLRLLWIGCGREDGLFAAAKSFSEFLTASKIKHTFHESSGAHTWMVWRRYLQDISPLLFQ